MAQFGALAGCLPPHYGFGFGLTEEQAQAIGLLSVSAAAGTKVAPGVASAAQSELTCNGAAVALPSRRRGREYAEHEPHMPAPAPPPILATHTQWSIVGAAAAHRLAESSSSATASTSGRPVPSSSALDALVVELCRQGFAEEVDALVRAECERLRAGVERACNRQRLALALAAARALREEEAALDAARRRAAGLEELLRRAAAERQAWRGVARSSEAAASGLRATLDALLLRAAGAGGVPSEEGFGDSGHDAAVAAAAGDAVSSCFVESAEDAGWACRACGAGEASVVVLPCRHLCLCKACEPRADACPVCLAAKNASIHVAAPH
ncbi:hypothetical protein BS78_K157600 [Paspalum vaginatum]|uniref:RING-type domain-containing protein n=1 Tax=Paspalum vaginatum TaxID=158149 RepID=A0A9W8CF33_9POAL|nr:hypothetical protein BS78_K157600 [Paspalum vaginatum]